MVRVAKIAVWDVAGELIRDSKAAEQRTREHLIRELIEKETPSEGELPEWISARWDLIEANVEKAMAGT